MIRAMDILQTAEKIMKGSQWNGGNTVNGTQYLTPGSYATADIPGSDHRVYKILSMESEGNARVKNIGTNKEYLIPVEFLCAIMTDDSYDYDGIDNYQIQDDEDDSSELEKFKVSQIGIKKPVTNDKVKGNGIDITGTSRDSYGMSRYDRTNQLAPISQISGK